MKTEICCNSFCSAVNAQKGGADRIELCANLEVGGVTPSEEDIRRAVNDLNIRTHVLIRPRGGDFCYSASELDVIEKDILMCKKLGVHAVVLGFLTVEGKIDVALTKRMVRLAAPMDVTFHRAFDEICQNPADALEAVIESGCTRLLTSGCKCTAIQGAETIARLVMQARGRITILAGSGLTPSNVAQLITETGVDEVHGSCKRVLDDGSVVTDTEIVKQFIRESNR